MLQSHPELLEMGAVEVDGVVIISTVHEETGYAIERCYSNWQLAKNDILDWIHRLSSLKNTASAPGWRRGRVRQTVKYDDVKRRPGGIGRASGPGRPSRISSVQKKKTASMEQQVTDITKAQVP